MSDGAGAFERLAPALRAHLGGSGWTPTPIQALSLDRIAAGEEALLVAPTGSGKTEAAVLPLFHRMLSDGWEPLSVLYVTPLRALNRALGGRLRELGQALGLRVDVRHGDTTQSQRSRQVRGPPHLLVTTPETLQLLFTGHRVRDMLRGVRAAVLDELHDLVAGERGAQLGFGLSRLEALTGRRIQRIGCSATVGNPAELARWMRPEATAIVDPGQRAIDLEVVMRPHEATDEITALEMGTSPQALAALRELVASVEETSPALLFVNSRHAAETVAQRMAALAPQLRIGVHHGSLATETRKDMEQRFHQGELDCIVSTSSLELGIDVGAIRQVLQLQSPRSVDRLLQRVGRAEHVLGGTSRGRLVAWEVDELGEAAVLARRAIAGELEPLLWRERPVSVLVNQLIQLGHQSRDIPLSALPRLIAATPAWQGWTPEQTLQVLRQLADRWLLDVVEDPLEVHPDGWPDAAFAIRAAGAKKGDDPAGSIAALRHTARTLSGPAREPSASEPPAQSPALDAERPPTGAPASAHGPAAEARRARQPPAATGSRPPRAPPASPGSAATGPRYDPLPPPARPLPAEARGRLRALLAPAWRDGWYRVSGRGMRHIRAHLSMIPDQRRYTVRDAVERRSLGTVDEAFVLSLSEEDVDAGTSNSARLFVMAGRTWRLIDADPAQDELIVTPAKATARAPVWSGELPPVPTEVAREVGWLRRLLVATLDDGRGAERTEDDGGPDLVSAPPWGLARTGPPPSLADYPLSDAALGHLMERTIEHIDRAGHVPSDRLLTIELRTDALVVNSCHGTQVNRTLAHAVQAMASTRTGRMGQVLVEPLRFALRMPDLRPDELRDLIVDLPRGALDGLLRVTLPNSAEMRWRLVQVAKMFGALSARADPRSINLHGMIQRLKGTPLVTEALDKLFHERLDIPGTEDLLTALVAGEIGLRVTPPGPLGRSPRSERDLLLPDWSSSEVRERLAKRLENERAVQCCLRCHGTRGFRVARFPKLDPACDNCGGTMLAVAPERQRDMLVEHVTSKDHATQQRMNKNAQLVQRRGIDAVLALMARGVGEETAIRLLRAAPPGDRDALLEAVHEAEITYARTRRFWG